MHRVGVRERERDGRGGNERVTGGAGERESVCVCVCMCLAWHCLLLPRIGVLRFVCHASRSNLGADKKVRTFLYYVLRQEAFEKGELRDVRLHSRGDNSPTSVQRRRSHRHAVAAGGEKPDLSDDDDEV